MRQWPVGGQTSAKEALRVFSLLTTLVDSRDPDLRQIAQDLGRDASVAGEELVISARSGLNTCVDRRTDPTHTCKRRQVTKLGAGWCRFKHLRRCRCSQRSRRKPGKTSKAPWWGAKRQMGTGGGQGLSFFTTFVSLAPLPRCLDPTAREWSKRPVYHIVTSCDVIDEINV